MFKKLLASLLSVLCLFSIVGVNVSAAPRATTENITYLEIFAEKAPCAKALAPSRDSSQYEEQELIYGDLFTVSGAQYCYAKVDADEKTYTILKSNESLVAGEKYAFIVVSWRDEERHENNPTFTDTDYYSPLFPHSFARTYTREETDGTVTYTDVTDVSPTPEGVKSFPTYIFYAPNKVDEVNITGLNIGAGEVPLASQPKSFFNGDDEQTKRTMCMYYLADEFDRAIDTKDVRESEIMDSSYTLEKGTRYYLSADIKSLFGSMEDNKYEYYPSKDLLVKINGQDANDMNSIWPDAELESNKDGVDNARYYIEFVANERTKQTDLIYTIPETYEWTITNSFDKNVENKFINVLNDKRDDNVEINVNVISTDLEKGNQLAIYVDSTNNWYMINEKDENEKYSYKVSVGEINTDKLEPTDSYWEEEAPILKCSADDEKLDGYVARARGIFQWENPNAIPKKAGTYKDTLTFTSEIIAPRVPKKGDLIYLDNNEEIQYRIIKTNGKNVELLSLTEFYLYTPNVGITFADGSSGIEYKNSNVDDLMENEYFDWGILDNIKNAIIETNIECYTYDAADDMISGRSSYATLPGTKCDTLSRHCYALDVKDIEEYFDNKGYTGEDLASFIGKESTTIWTRSVGTWEASNDSAYYLNVFGDNAEISYDVVSGTPSNCVYPAFTIDLSKIDYKFADDAE